MRILLVLLLSLPLFAPLTAGGGGSVVFKQSSFMAEVASTDQERAKGLMYRQSLAKDRCMFFIYADDADHAIWMKNCLISLDVAWVDKDGKVVETGKSADLFANPRTPYSKALLAAAFDYADITAGPGSSDKA